MVSGLVLSQYFFMIFNEGFWVLFSFTSQKYLIKKTDVSVAIQLPSSMHKTVKHPRASLLFMH